MINSTSIQVISTASPSQAKRIVRLTNRSETFSAMGNVVDGRNFSDLNLTSPISGAR
jgi:hypothetical protein